MDSIFIIGTGRSGTHFTCRALQGFKNIYDPLDGKENGSVLKDIAVASIHHFEYPKNAIDYYIKVKKHIEKNKIFLDQHHPNIFYINNLSKIFTNPIFIYPDRPIEQVVASMLKHRGVLSWFEYAKNKPKNVIPIENQFLGIQELNQLQEMELYELCALRVIAHRNRAILMKNRGMNVRFLNYENLVRDQLAEFNEVFSEQEFDRLGDFDVVEESNSSSLHKFRDILQPQQLARIENLLKQFGRCH